jgi:excisionase family DNA binding protein
MTTWLTAAEAAKYANRCADTIRIAAQLGELHGHQAGRKGRWSFKPECVDAWLERRNSAVACGCQNLRLARRSA